MISDALISAVRGYAYDQAKLYGVPSEMNINLSNAKGQWLAHKLGADKNIVLVGTLLMDCEIGRAMKEKRLNDHVELSVEKSRELLSEWKDLTEAERENIIACVKQHHGSEKFYSLESEICCNADCYRFASVEGVIGNIRSWQGLSLEEMVSLLSSKADEKYGALSLEVCKKELEPQYTIIKQFLTAFNE